MYLQNLLFIHPKIRKILLFQVELKTKNFFVTTFLIITLLHLGLRTSDLAQFLWNWLFRSRQNLKAWPFTVFLKRCFLTLLQRVLVNNIFSHHNSDVSWPTSKIFAYSSKIWKILQLKVGLETQPTKYLNLVKILP